MIRALSAFGMILLLAACGSSPEVRDASISPKYSPEIVRKAVVGNALTMEVVGSPGEFTGARAIADAMTMPAHFKGIQLAGEPPTGSGTTTTRLVLGFNVRQRVPPELFCENAASIRGGRGQALDVLAVLCVGDQVVSSGRITGPSYASIELKDFRAQMAWFLGQVMPATAQAKP
jgi:hypothetical protein